MATNKQLEAEIAELKELLKTAIAVGSTAPVVGKVRTFATKAERAEGNGFACDCGRNDLRMQPQSGDWHNRPNGTRHEIA